MTDTLDSLIAHIDGLFPDARISDVAERSVKVLGADVSALHRRIDAARLARLYTGPVATTPLDIPGVEGDVRVAFRVFKRLPPLLVLKGPRNRTAKYSLRREVVWELPFDASPGRVAAALRGEVGTLREKHRESYVQEGGRYPFHLTIDTVSKKDSVVRIEAGSDEAVEHALEQLELAHHEFDATA